MLGKIVNLCDRGTHIASDVKRQKDYEQAKTDPVSKRNAVKAVSEFFCAIRAQKIDAYKADKKARVRTDTGAAEEPPDYITLIFEKIDEIKQNSSGWFGCGRATDTTLSKLHGELDKLILDAYTALSYERKTALLTLLGESTHPTESTPILNRSEPIVTCIQQHFDTIMRNHSRFFQVIIPKTLANLYIEEKARERLKLYPNKFIERHTIVRRDGKIELAYWLINPKNRKQRMLIALKVRDKENKYLYLRNDVGEGNFGSVRVYRSTLEQDSEGGEYNKYAKKFMQGTTKKSKLDITEREQFMVSYYTASLQFALKKELEDKVRLNHPLVFADSNIKKTIARVAEGTPWNKELNVSPAQFQQMLDITTEIHLCGGLALDQKPSNYMQQDETVVRIDLDFDAVAVARLAGKNFFSGGNLGEMPCVGSVPRKMYEVLTCDHNIEYADCYRGQSLAGLVINCVEAFTSARDAEFLRGQLNAFLPMDVSPHNRTELINFVVNWRFNQNHRDIAIFLQNYRKNNGLMDPMEHLSLEMRRENNNGFTSPEALYGLY